MRCRPSPRSAKSGCTCSRPTASDSSERKPAMDVMNGLPIGDYALVSDCRCAALGSRAGAGGWLFSPRFDAPAVFARILDPAGGHFAIRPGGEFDVSRCYVDQTMAL